MKILEVILENELFLGLVLFNVFLIFTYYPRTIWEQAMIRKSYRFSLFFMIFELVFFIIFIGHTFHFLNSFLATFYTYISLFVYLQNIFFVAIGFYYFVILYQKEISPIVAIIAPEITLILYSLSKMKLIDETGIYIALGQCVLSFFSYWLLLRQISIYYKRY